MRDGERFHFEIGRHRLRRCRHSWYPPFAKYAKNGAPTILLMPAGSKDWATRPEIWKRAVAPVAEWVAKQFWSTTQRRTSSNLAPTHLTQAHRRGVKGISPQRIKPVVLRTENLCPGCGKTIQDRSTTCARCAVGVATRNMLKAARIGRGTANGLAAQAKRAIKARKNALAQHSWKLSDQPAWLTSELFAQRIQPLLSNIPTAVISSSVGVSRWYAGKIRKGYGPHRRHWKVLAELVGIMG
jgi:hypothetical protein